MSDATKDNAAFPPEGTRLFDAHCHLDFMTNATEVAEDARTIGLSFLATTTGSEGYRSLAHVLANRPNVRVAPGLHPWWVADGRADGRAVDAACSLAEGSSWVGEVGIDLSPHHVPEGSRDIQAQAFERVCQAAARSARKSGSPTVISIHSVRGATLALDILEETGCLATCRPVFHWFSGTSDELTRAVRSGLWFSVNEMMLKTRRGREYARQIPIERLLTETDLPPEEGKPFSARAVADSIERTISALGKIRDMDEAELAEAIVDNACSLFSPASQAQQGHYARR